MKKDRSDNYIAAFLDGELDEEKECEMKRELNRDKAMQQEVDDYSKLWDKSSQVSQFEGVDTENDWKTVRKRMGFENKSKKIPLQKYLLRISAILVLAFGLAYFFNQIVNRVPIGISTDYFQEMATNDIKMVTLPDGTVVTLNKHAGLFYNSDFGAGNRDVILEGEAFFEVTRNENLAFKVFASNSTIEVLGTSFNVNSNEQGVHLSVVTGHVAFFETSDKVNRIELTKDEMVAYKSSSRQFTGKIDINPNLIAWKTGKLEFRDVPMGEVFSTIAVFFGKELVLENNVQLSREFKGTFNNQSLEEIITAIEMTTLQEFKVSVNNSQIIISN